jgi:predicted nucleic acid-binding protein
MKNGFVDSNILLYAADGRRAEADKAAIARELLSQGGLCVSVQVISEFTAVASHPRKLEMTRDETALYCEMWEREFEVHPLTADHLALAREWFVPGILSWWDSLIVASANLSGCERLYSEDLNGGEKFGAVTIINPFVDLA